MFKITILQTEELLNLEILDLPALLNMCRAAIWYDLSPCSRKVKALDLRKII